MENRVRMKKYIKIDYLDSADRMAIDGHMCLIFDIVSSMFKQYNIMLIFITKHLQKRSGELLSIYYLNYDEKQRFISV